MSLLYLSLTFHAFIVATFSMDCRKEIKLNDGNLTYEALGNAYCRTKIADRPDFALVLRIHNISIQGKEENEGIVMIMPGSLTMRITGDLATKMYRQSGMCQILLSPKSPCTREEIIRSVAMNACSTFFWMTVDSLPSYLDISFGARNGSYDLDYKYIQCRDAKSEASTSSNTSTTPCPTTFSSLTHTVMENGKTTKQPSDEPAVTTMQPGTEVIETSSGANVGCCSTLVVPLAFVSALLVASWTVFGIWIVKLKKEKARTPPVEKHDNPQDNEPPPELIVNEIYDMQPANSANVQRQAVGDAVYTIVARQ